MAPCPSIAVYSAQAGSSKRKPSQAEDASTESEDECIPFSKKGKWPEFDRDAPDSEEELRRAQLEVDREYTKHLQHLENQYNLQGLKKQSLDARTKTHV